MTRVSDLPKPFKRRFEKEPNHRIPLPPAERQLDEAIPVWTLADVPVGSLHFSVQVETLRFAEIPRSPGEIPKLPIVALCLAQDERFLVTAACNVQFTEVEAMDLPALPGMVRYIEPLEGAEVAAFVTEHRIEQQIHEVVHVLSSI